MTYPEGAFFEWHLTQYLKCEIFITIFFFDNKQVAVLTLLCILTCLASIGSNYCINGGNLRQVVRKVDNLRW